MNDRFRSVLNEMLQDNVDSVRDRATWEGASIVERETFGKVFNVIEGVVGLITIFGCVIISSITQNSHFLMYVLGILWLIPCVAVGALLVRFRHRVFVRVRGIMNNFLGGGGIR